MAAEVSYNSAWYTLGGTLSKKEVVSKSYTPFGEQIGEQTSGFGYNGEYYNAATGMVYLRARFYEPEMNRFSQKDILRGSVTDPASLNRYAYVQNDPVNFIDPSGESRAYAASNAASKISGGVKTLASAANRVAANTVKTKAYAPAYSSAASAAKAAQAAARVSATSEAAARASQAAKMSYLYANEARMTGSAAAVQKAAQSASMANYYANEARMSGGGAAVREAGQAASRANYYANEAQMSGYSSGKATSTQTPSIRPISNQQAGACLSASSIPDIYALSGGTMGIEAYEPVAKILKIFYESLEVKAGIGQGLGGDIEILGLGGDLVIGGNYIEARLDDGKWSFGQSIRAEASLDLALGDIGGRWTEYHDFNGNVIDELDESYLGWGAKLPNGTAISAYFIIGGSFSIEINYSDLIDNWERYKEEQNEKQK